MKPIVSLVVAIYNVDPYLEQCIESVIHQTEKNIEIILVDDGSTDRSPELCDTYAGRDSRIRVIHQMNAGVSAARNAGIAAATADWIAFMDGDDFLDEHYVEKMISATGEDLDIVCCAYYTYDEEGKKKKEFFKDEFLYKSIDEKTPLFYQLMQSHYGQESSSRGTGIGVPWAKLYRAKMVKKMAFHTGLRRMQDNVFNMYAFYNARGVKYIKEHLYFYRLSHISGYRKTYYKPEIYERVLNERDLFFNRDAFFSQSDFMEHRLQEKGEYLYRSCKNIVVTSEDFECAQTGLNKLRDLNVYGELLKGRYEMKSVTRKIVIHLWRRKGYRHLYFGLGYYWKRKK